MRSEHKRYQVQQPKKQQTKPRRETQNQREIYRVIPPRGLARIWDGHHVTKRALGSEVWSQGETDEDIYQREADEDI